MERLDKFLVQKNLAPTRTKAQEIIEQGAVLVEGKEIKKPSFLVDENSEMQIRESEVLKYVSRGGLKLEKALKVFNVDLKNRVVLDIGSSTGGFTDCCLQYGAKKVIAVDVGTNVMVEKLRKNPQVELHENTNIKTAEHALFMVDCVVTDVSFISLKQIADKLASENIKMEVVALIKPQFECGVEVAKKYRGIIKSKTVHKEVLKNVIEHFKKCGFNLLGLDFSPIKGGDGNIEYLGHFSNRGEPSATISLEKVVNTAFSA